MIWWFWILAAYLGGSLPFGYLVTRWTAGFDIRTVGSGNLGTTNVLRMVGRGPALIVLTSDMAKGALPVLVGLWLGAPDWVVATAGFAAIVGHVFPVYLGFRGGKGVATAVGAFVSLAPLATLASIIVFALTVTSTRYVSLGSVLSVITFPIWLYLGGRWGWLQAPAVSLVGISVATAILIVARHLTNLERIAAGREHRLGERVEVNSK